MDELAELEAIANFDISEQIEAIEKEGQTELNRLELENKKQFEATEKELQADKEQDLKRQETEQKEAGEVKDETQDDEQIERDKLGRTYPNQTAIKKLNESEAVELGKSLGLPNHIDLKASENDKILIDYFTKNIW